MYIYAALLADLLLFPLISWQSLLSSFLGGCWGAGRHRTVVGESEFPSLRGLGWVISGWRECGAAVISVVVVCRETLHLGVLWVSITRGALLSGSLSPTVSAEFLRSLNLVTLCIGQPSPVTCTRNLASSGSPASMILASEPLKLCAGISVLILLTFCGGEK